MNINFVHDTFTNKEGLYRSDYARRLRGVTDDFWEHHILEGELYRICDDQTRIGYFTIFDAERISSFSIEWKYQFAARDIFRRILGEFGIKHAFAATCDETLLSLCMDFCAKVEPQAYLFDGTQPMQVRAAEYPRECLRQIASEEMATVNANTDSFFDGDATGESLRSGAQMMYALEDNGTPLGYCIIVPLRIQPQYYACGMYTMPDLRRGGIGRSMQLHMGDIVRESGHIPVSGCWFHNELSKKTIESAGRYTHTRLLNFTF